MSPMDPDQQKRLEAAGWAVGTGEEFLAPDCPRCAALLAEVARLRAPNCASCHKPMEHIGYHCPRC